MAPISITVQATIPHGGSHGGEGGSGPPVYGSAIAPVLFGSGGGSVGLGGNGGGRVDLVVNGTLTVDGQLRANGGDHGGPDAAGNGGAGGSLRLRVNHLAGQGVITANGGAGNWAGGGGGRIAAEYVDSAFTGTITANGSATGDPGDPGSVVLTAQSAGAAVPHLQAAGAATCALDEVGRLDCWGDDSDGLISDAPAGIYTALAVGSHSACALHRSGLPHRWGAGGDGGAVLHAPRTSLSAIAVALDAACGLQSGTGGILLLGHGRSRPAERRAGGAFVDLAMTDTAACARGAAGDLHCWGSDSDGQVTGKPASAVSQLDGGEAHFCAVLSDGAVACWGSDAEGQSTPPEGSYTQVTAGGSPQLRAGYVRRGDVLGRGRRGAGEPAGRPLRCDRGRRKPHLRRHAVRHLRLLGAVAGLGGLFGEVHHQVDQQPRAEAGRALRAPRLVAARRARCRRCRGAPTACRPRTPRGTAPR